jgi:hypothetical protein
MPYEIALLTAVAPASFLQQLEEKCPMLSHFRKTHFKFAVDLLNYLLHGLSLSQQTKIA